MVKVSYILTECLVGKTKPGEDIIKRYISIRCRLKLVEFWGLLSFNLTFSQTIHHNCISTPPPLLFRSPHPLFFFSTICLWLSSLLFLVIHLDCVGHEIPFIIWALNQNSHSLANPTSSVDSIGPTHLAGRIGCRSMVLSLSWCLGATNGSFLATDDGLFRLYILHYQESTLDQSSQNSGRFYYTWPFSIQHFLVYT